MVKVGKLVGEQSFFYGSIEISEEKLILNLKLIDVTSSAIVYSKRFTGEAYASFTRLCIGWGYSTVSYGTTFEVYEGNTLLHQKEMKDLQASTMMYFILTYKQGFKDLKWAQFGVDFNFVQYSAPSNGEYEADFDANGINYTPGHELTVHFYSLKPRIYLSSKYILGWQHDWLNPYLGVAVNMISFGGNFHGAKDQLNPWQRIGGWEEKEIEADSYVVLTPIAGLEINLTKGLTLFAEGTFYINDAECQEKQDNYVAEMVMESTPYIAKGIYWNAGVKYYFTIF